MQKNVLITGAARRIGAACARLLHAEGCNIAIHYRHSATAAAALGAELNAIRPDSAVTLQAELTNLRSIVCLAENARSVWNGIDILINNASTFYPTDIAKVSESQWHELMDSNLKAPFFLSRGLLATLTENKGSIVNIVDIHAERGLPGYSVYSIAKAALCAMTLILAKEFAPNVRVNAVAPGAILWPEQGLTDAEKQRIIAHIPLQRQGGLDDIAKAVRYLVKDAEYVTGQIVRVDGGRLLNC